MFKFHMLKNSTTFQISNFLDFKYDFNFQLSICVCGWFNVQLVPIYIYIYIYIYWFIMEHCLSFVGSLWKIV
jgi:hypothetical protein